MPRMRLVKDAFEQLKKDDPDTDVTLYALRTIVKSGLIPTVRLGRKVLITILFWSISVSVIKSKQPQMLFVRLIDNREC